tara:strand:- start:218 stop:445 length:228 start_codon:yes stop_codon:yes gene_type:complete
MKTKEYKSLIEQEKSLMKAHLLKIEKSEKDLLQIIEEQEKRLEELYNKFTEQIISLDAKFIAGLESIYSMPKNDR